MAEVNGEEEQRVLIGKRCYVGNLPWKTSWQDLKDKFRECGEVVYTNVMRDGDNRSKGWGIVEFQKPEEALAAINSLNGAEMDGRRILVREDREDRDVKNFTGEAPEGGRGRRGRSGRGRGRGGRTGGRGRGRSAGRAPSEAANGASASSGLQIVVQGIPWAWTGEDLKQKFVEIDEVVKSEIAIGYDNRSRGFGTVGFATTEAANRAIEAFHGTELEGRTLAVFLDKYA